MKKLLFTAVVFGMFVSGGLLAGGKVKKDTYNPVHPIVFHDKYDISFFGFEIFHPFDTKKYSKVAKHLEKSFGVKRSSFYKPEMISDKDLLLVHTAEYLESLKNSMVIRRIAGVPFLDLFPNGALQRNLLDRMRYATAGTVLGAELAMKHGWSVNLSGGYHHAKRNNGEGFCFFADIPLAIKKLREKNPELKVLIVDLDAHQGNGLEDILGTDPLTVIFDMYSENNYPHDTALYQYIDYNHPLRDYIKDAEYLDILKTSLPKAIEDTSPDLIIYNAGTDIFERDPLGKMRVSAQGIFKRDEFVFDQAFNTKTPIAMTLSGGYTKQSAGIIGQSIESIIKKHTLI